MLPLRQFQCHLVWMAMALFASSSKSCSASSFYPSFLTAIDVGVVWACRSSAFFPQVVSQAPQHFRSGRGATATGDGRFVFGVRAGNAIWTHWEGWAHTAELRPPQGGLWPRALSVSLTPQVRLLPVSSMHNKFLMTVNLGWQLFRLAAHQNGRPKRYCYPQSPLQYEKHFAASSVSCRPCCALPVCTTVFLSSLLCTAVVHYGLLVVLVVHCRCALRALVVLVVHCRCALRALVVLVVHCRCALRSLVVLVVHCRCALRSLVVLVVHSRYALPVWRPRSHWSFGHFLARGICDCSFWTVA